MISKNLFPIISFIYFFQYLSEISKTVKSLNSLNSFHLHIGKNKNDRTQFFGYHDALKIYGAPKLCTVMY